jgi:excisionase family DNA binding protein
MSENLLTPEQVAKRLAVNPDTVRHWLRAGTLQGVKIGPGKIWRISEEELNRFIKGNKQD